MGLDTSHNAWHGANSAFSRWRNELARVAGYQVAKIGDSWYEMPVIDWGHIEPDNYMGEWRKAPSDPLVVLIAHSDCEGVIHPEHAEALAERLTELLPLLDGDGGGHIGNYREKTEQFIAGLRAAAEADEDVDFH